jgi:hypothetical protein
MLRVISISLICSVKQKWRRNKKLFSLRKNVKQKAVRYELQSLQDPELSLPTHSKCICTPLTVFPLDSFTTAPCMFPAIKVQGLLVSTYLNMELH